MVAGWLERYRAYLFFLLIVAILAAIALFAVLRPRPEAILLGTATPARFLEPEIELEATATPRPLRVYVSGAVKQADVYVLAPDSIVKDAVLAAGGAADDADLDRINLASPLVDGQHIYVPRQGEENPPVQPPAGQPAAGGKVNINTAESTALETLPGIGPSLAQRIIDYRQANGPFGQIEDIMEVSGIGPATFDKIRDLITTN
jgi:competence protein ComEA